MTLTEFLMARFDEDEASATLALTRDHWHYEGYGDFGPYVSGAGVETEDSDQGQSVARYLERMNPWRALAECEAKRRIVGIYGRLQFGDGYDGKPVPLGGDGPETYWDAIRLLALPYSDHPDYDPEWRP